jgi:hypothetical protein
VIPKDVESHRFLHSKANYELVRRMPSRGTSEPFTNWLSFDRNFHLCSRFQAHLLAVFRGQRVVDAYVGHERGEKDEAFAAAKIPVLPSQAMRTR